MLFVCISGFLTACVRWRTGVGEFSGDDIELQVLAAASLNAAFLEMGAAFEADYPGVEVTFVFAGSQQLALQLEQGAPADVFASANPENMQKAQESGRVSHNVHIFAANSLLVIVPQPNPAAIYQLVDLARPGLKIVLAAVEAPVGKYTAEFLEKSSTDPLLPMDFQEMVMANVVSYENNVKAVVAKVSLGEADAGIVYRTDVSVETGEEIGWIEIPETLNRRAEYPIAALQDSPNPQMAQAFVEFVLSEAGRKILLKHGFLLPAEK